MKEGQSLWTEEESILAVNLYAKIPFGQMHRNNGDVKELAALINRTPSAVARKLGNFASFDPKLKERGIKGLSNASKLDKIIWNEYMNNWDETFVEGEKLLAQKKNTSIEKLYQMDLENYDDVEGKERQRLVSVRLNQSIFRKLVLSNYDNKCCITGINITELLVASHILPWSKDKKNRLNPQNGLALNTLHDKAFDRGLITITEDLKIKVSSTLLAHREVMSIQQNFVEYDGKELISPQKFMPSSEFLKVHNESFRV